jgi:predicted peroxiredoxin
MAMKFVYFVTTGVGDPTRASIPLHMAANGSLEVGHDVAVVLAGDGSEIVLGDNAQTIEGVGVPPMRDLLAKLKDHGVPVYV